MNPAILPASNAGAATQAETAPTSIARPSSAACPLPIPLIKKCLDFVPKEYRDPLTKGCQTFKAALEVQDPNILRSLKSFSTNLAYLVNAENGKPDFPQELAPLSEEISRILNTSDLTLLESEAQIFAKLIELSPEAFAYLYTKFDIQEYHSEETPFPSDKFKKTYQYLQNPDRLYTTLLQAQLYRGIAHGYLSDEVLVVGNRVGKATTLLIEDLAKKEKFNLAKAIFDSIPRDPEERRDDFAVDFSTALCEAGNPRLAFDVVKKIKNSLKQFMVFHKIGKSFAELETDFEKMHEALKNVLNLLGRDCCLVPEDLKDLVQPLLKKGRLDLALKFFSSYQDGRTPPRSILPKTYVALRKHFNEEHHAATIGHDWREKEIPEIELELSNRRPLAKIGEMIPLAQNHKDLPDATVNQWLSEMEDKDRKLCCAHLAIQLHLRGFREAALYYASLIN